MSNYIWTILYCIWINLHYIYKNEVNIIKLMLIKLTWEQLYFFLLCY